MGGSPLLASFSLALAANGLWLVLLVLLSLALAVLAYRRTVPEVTGARKVLLIGIRALALSLLFFLLFEPVLNLLRIETRPPRIAVLLDDSRSLTIADQGVERKEQLRALLAKPEWKDLLSRSDVDVTLVSTRPRKLERFSVDSLHWRGGETDFDAAFRAVQERLVTDNIRSVLLVSDGVYTAGRNPLHRVQSLGIPVSTVVVGDTAQKKDILVGNVIANDIGYVGSELPVDVGIRTSGYGAESITVTLREGNTVVANRTLTLQPGLTEVRVPLTYTATSAGTKRLVVEVSSLPGEVTDRNNRRNVFMTIRGSKMNIVVVAGAPSPDLSLVDQVLSRDKNLETRIFVEKPGRQWYDRAPTLEDLRQADCIVLVGYPTIQSNPNALQWTRQVLEEKGRPVFVLFSRELDAGKLASGLGPWLPMDVVATRPQESQVQYQPAPEGKDHPIVSSNLPPSVWSNLPPLFKTESSFKPRPGSEKLATMNINGIAFQEPIFLTRTLNRTKVAVMTAYGLWRWQLATDVENGMVPERLFANSIRWLTTRDDNKRVRIAPVRPVFDSGEPVEFTGQVYNESEEPVSDADLVVRITGTRGTIDLALSPLGAGRYVGAMESPGEGEFTYTGTARRGDRSLGTDAGRFAVGELSAEFQDTRANATLMRQIAARSGGRAWMADAVRDVDATLSRGDGFVPASVEEKRDIELWNRIWILVPVLLLFAVEWALRKRTGLL